VHAKLKVQPITQNSRPRYQKNAVNKHSALFSDKEGQPHMQNSVLDEEDISLAKKRVEFGHGAEQQNIGQSVINSADELEDIWKHA
jgi:hypothetical protein